VDCPIPAEELPVAAGGLWYIDNSTGAITCTYRVEDNLSTFVTQDTQVSTDDDNVYRSLSFQPDWMRNGHHHIRCLIPRRDAAGNASDIVGYDGG
jgi:hypothetical protein